MIGAKEMSQGIKRLLRNHEDLSLNLWMNPHKNQVEAHICNPSIGQQRNVDTRGLLPSQSRRNDSSTFNERHLSLKKKKRHIGRNDSGDISEEEAGRS